MGIFGRLERSTVRADVTFSPVDDFWYNPVGESTFAGMPIAPATALRTSVVFACVSLIAETVASLPCILYRRREDGGKERATKHRLYRVLRYQPNRWQTAMDFFGTGQTHVGLRGDLVAEKLDIAGGLELSPLHPDRLQIEQIATGRMRYRYHDPATGKERVLTQDEVLHVRDLSTDGLSGLARSSLAREAIAVARAAEAMAAGYFKNDATGRLVLTFPNALTDKQKADLKRDLDTVIAGWKNARRAMFVDNGAKVEAMGGPDDSAFLLDPRKFQVSDIARFWRVPGFMIGLEEKSTSWGSGLENQKQGFVDFTIRPWLVRWEQALARDLLTEAEQEEYFFEFLLDGLLRGDILSTVQALQIERANGALSRNEWRIIRNRNPVEGGDAMLETPVGASPNPAPPAPRPTHAPSDDEDEMMGSVALAPFVADAAARIAAAETREIEKKAPMADDGARWRAWLGKFYGEHRRYATRVVQTVVKARGLEPWVAETIGERVETSALAELEDGVPDGWADRRQAAVALLIEEALTAGAAASRAA